ncbi:hypothetical protein SB00610_05359 [Klebsiella quasipneumoniae subsp. similipneumoniae]|nr:hypothetical protein SB00610_05359 [Klebsiella quasipneumoniae subsp. similipneumoniae]
MVFRDTTAERTAAHDFLLYWCELLQPEAWFATQLPHGSIQHNVEVFPDKTDIGISQLKHCFNAHSLQFFTDAAPDSPDLIHRQQSHQLPLSFQIRQIHHSSGLSLPLFRSVIGQLCQCFSLGYADADREVRPA